MRPYGPVTDTASAEQRSPLLRVGWRPAHEPSAADRLLADLVTWHLGTSLEVGRRCRRPPWTLQSTAAAGIAQILPA